MTLTTGQILHNRYRIVKLLGQGGFGAVYRAWDTNLHGPCAVKENFETSAAAQSQFAREASILFNLRHPNLPRVFDQFSVAGQGQYLVMDFIEGEDLQSKLEKAGGPLPEAQVVKWITQVSDALEYLHAQNPPIIHRDIKPKNVIISSQDQAMLVDFGIAKVYDSRLKTTLGARAVTPGYSPHEQYGQGTTDARSDIYALGAMAYALLTGVEPLESIQRFLRDPLVPAEELNPSLSSGTVAALMKALRMDPDMRYQSMSEFKAALQSQTPAPVQEPALRQAPIPLQPRVQKQVAPAVEIPAAGRPVVQKAAPARPTAAPRKFPRKAMLGIVLLLFLAAAGILIGIFISNQKPAATPTEVIQVAAPTEAIPAAPPTEVAAKPAPATATALPIIPPTLEKAPSEADCGKVEVFCVGLVTDVGGIEDKSFNQSAWQGVTIAQEKLGAIVRFIETKDPADYLKNVIFFGDRQYDVIVTVGFALSEATVMAAKKFPDIKFIGVDENQDRVLPNVVGLIFPEDQAGFLVGALAAMMSKTGMIGAVCGTDAIPPVWRFCEGYRAGAVNMNPKINVIVFYHNEIGIDRAFTDPEWGRKVAYDMIAKGADVIFGAGGQTGNGALMGAAQQGKYAIGVDTDQYYTLPEVRKVLLSSAMKMITPGVFDLIMMAKEGKFPSGNFLGPVGYAPYHDTEDQVPPEVKAKMEEVLMLLREGKLRTNVPPSKP